VYLLLVTKQHGKRVGLDVPCQNIEAMHGKNESYQNTNKPAEILSNHPIRLPCVTSPFALSKIMQMHVKLTRMARDWSVMAAAIPHYGTHPSSTLTHCILLIPLPR